MTYCVTLLFREKVFLQGEHDPVFDDETRVAVKCEREIYERRPPSENDYETVRVRRYLFYNFNASYIGIDQK